MAADQIYPFRPSAEMFADFRETSYSSRTSGTVFVVKIWRCTFLGFINSAYISLILYNFCCWKFTAKVPENPDYLLSEFWSIFDNFKDIINFCSLITIILQFANSVRSFSIKSRLLCILINVKTHFSMFLLHAAYFRVIGVILAVQHYEFHFINSFVRMGLRRQYFILCLFSV